MSMHLNHLLGFSHRTIHVPRFTDNLTKLGILSTASLVLDFGDSNCTDLSAQQVNDLSGVGNHFNRGTTSGSDATDPTPAGTAGALTSAEGYTVDGGDFFTPVSAITIDDGLHKSGAVFTFVAVLVVGATGAFQVVFGNHASANVQGVEWSIGASPTMRLTVYNGTTSGSIGVSGKSVAAGGTYFICHSHSEAAGANGSFCMVNSQVTMYNGSYAGIGTGPSATDPASNPSIMGRGGTSATNAMSNGSRLAAFALWPTAQQPVGLMRELYDSCRRPRWRTL